eukprot:scaffold70525_cov60-Phaeocystis_antarctica.AAC.1
MRGPNARMPEWPDVARRGPSARTARRGPPWAEMPECRNGTTWLNVARKPEWPDVARRGPKYRASVPPDLPGHCCRATNALHQRQHRASAPPDLPGCRCRATNALHQRHHRASAPPDLP